MNASGTARPISPATPTPFSVIAAVGAMIASERAIASQNLSSRRRPPPPPTGSSLASASTATGQPSSPRMSRGRNAPTTQFGASTTSWIRRSAATDAIA
jgi:hypothetical protein